MTWLVCDLEMKQLRLLERGSSLQWADDVDEGKREREQLRTRRRGLMKLLALVNGQVERAGSL